MKVRMLCQSQPTRHGARPSFRQCTLFIFFAVASIGFVAASTAQSPHPLTPKEEQEVETLIHRLGLLQKLDYIGGASFGILPLPSVGIPALEMSDGPYGVRSNTGLPATAFAAGIGLAASWDKALARHVGAGIGRDARARGIHFMLGPGVNIYRSPLNGRNFEYFGEDPFLASQIAVGYISGMQEQGVSATIKHFVGNDSEFLRHDADSVIEERALREIYLPAFEAAVKDAHVGAVMDSYNLVNGVHATENAYLNTDILRREWGFKGVMMSDWGATYSAIAAANGGLDLEMPSGKFMNRENLLQAVRDGKVSESTIDEKVRHILTTAISFGWFQRPQIDTSISLFDAKNRDTALQSAREAIVLLKNDGHLLPLSKSQIRTLLVVGPDAYPGVGVGRGSAGVIPFHLVSSLEGLTNALGSAVTVLYDRGLPTLSEMAASTAFATDRTGTRPGLQMETFENEKLSSPVSKSTVIQHINFVGTTWATLPDTPDAMDAYVSQGGRQLSRRFTGFYRAPTSGKYILALQGAGEGSGNRVYLDDQLVIDDWNMGRAFQPHVTIQLGAGAHRVVVEDFQNGPVGGRLRFGIVGQDAVVSVAARDLAAKADAVLVAVGFDLDSEGENIDRTFELPFGQDELIRAMAGTNKKTIVSVTSGGNIDSSSWIARVPALLQSWYGGQEGGTALAEILTGRTNPSGHLPITLESEPKDNPTFATYYPERGSKTVNYNEGIFVGYRGYEANHIRPLFPFGFGLSYTTFAFTDLSIDLQSPGQNPLAIVSFDVTNTGNCAGAQVAQVYISDKRPSVPRPIHELKGFERVELAPGETKRLFIDLDARAFAFYDVAKHKWAINAGIFVVNVGDSVQDLKLSGTLELHSEAAITKP